MIRGPIPLSVQLAAAFAGIAVASVIVLGVPGYLVAGSVLGDAEGERLASAAEIAAVGIRRDATDAERAEWVATVRDEGALGSVRLVAADGRVLAESGSPMGADPVLRDAGAIAEARAGDAGVGEPFVGRDGATWAAAYAAVESDPGLVLGVEALAPTGRVTALQTGFAVAGVVWFALVATAGVYAARRLGRPLAQLAEAAGRVEGGEDLLLAQGAGPREVVDLAGSFARMAAAIRGREAWLRALGGMVAHEVRNPANALSLELGLARREAARGDVGRLGERFAVMEDELRHLDEIVESFLAFSTGKPPRRRTVTLAGLLAPLADVAELHVTDTTAEVDPVLVVRAVGNLVRNARQAGATRVVVDAVVEDAQLVLRVTDNGGGLPATLGGDPFDPLVTGREGGSGVGLAIVAAVARSHGGAVRLVSSGPTGVVVELRLA